MVKEKGKENLKKDRGAKNQMKKMIQQKPT